MDLCDVPTLFSSYLLLTQYLSHYLLLLIPMCIVITLCWVSVVHPILWEEYILAQHFWKKLCSLPPLQKLDFMKNHYLGCKCVIDCASINIPTVMFVLALMIFGTGVSKVPIRQHTHPSPDKYLPILI